MDEAMIRNNVMNKIRVIEPKVVMIRYEDQFQRGIPDLSVSAYSITSMWEWKRQGLIDDVPEVQRQQLLEFIEDAGIPAYFALVDSKKRFHIIHPNNMIPIKSVAYTPMNAAKLLMEYHVKPAIVYPEEAPMKHFRVEHKPEHIVPNPGDKYRGVIVDRTEIQKPLMVGVMKETMTIFYQRGEPECAAL